MAGSIMYRTYYPTAVPSNSLNYPVGFHDAPLLHDIAAQDSTTYYVVGSNNANHCTLAAVIDLGSAKAVDEAKGYITSVGGVGGTIYSSADGVTWTSRAVLGSDGAFDQVLATTARYWLMLQTGGGSPGAEQLRNGDFRLYLNGVEYTYTNVALPKGGSLLPIIGI